MFFRPHTCVFNLSQKVMGGLLVFIAILFGYSGNCHSNALSRGAWFHSGPDWDSNPRYCFAGLGCQPLDHHHTLCFLSFSLDMEIVKYLQVNKVNNLLLDLFFTSGIRYQSSDTHYMYFIMPLIRQPIRIQHMMTLSLWRHSRLFQNVLLIRGSCTNTLILLKHGTRIIRWLLVHIKRDISGHQYPSWFSSS